jgi:hypothetical protein
MQDRIHTLHVLLADRQKDNSILQKYGPEFMLCFSFYVSVSRDGNSPDIEKRHALIYLSHISTLN